MNSVSFHIHSVVDLITNSSSEIFTFVNTGYIKSVKELINELLKQGGSTKTADDLFDIEVECRYINDSNEDVSVRGILIVSGDEAWLTDDEAKEVKVFDFYKSERGNRLRVTAKDPSVELAAKILGAINNLFISREVAC